MQRAVLFAAFFAHAGCANDAAQCAQAASALEGWCTTYCTTTVGCTGSPVCQLAPVGCNARWAECHDGTFVVYTTGHACPDAGTDAAP